MRIPVRLPPLFLLGFISACIKGKDAGLPAPTPKQQLAGSWQLTAYTADSVFSNTDTLRSNAYAALPDCRRDDIFEFGTDGILLLQQGAVNCDPAGGTTVVLGYWKLLEKPLRLVMDDPDLSGNSDTLNVETLDNSTLTVNKQFVFSKPSGLEIQVHLRKTYTLKK